MKAKLVIGDTILDFLVSQDKYLEAGVHIGTKTKTGKMRNYIYKAREDGLHVLDLKKTNDRIKDAITMLSRYPPEKIYVVGGKDNAKTPIMKLCELTGFKPIVERFTPGRFTNPSRSDFNEPKIVFIIDPAVDKQALKEAFESDIPTIALCDTNNEVKYVDLVVPTNNKGKKALSLILWIIGRETWKLQGKNKDEFPELKDFLG